MDGAKTKQSNKNNKNTKKRKEKVRICSENDNEKNFFPSTRELKFHYQYIFFLSRSSDYN